MKVTDERINAHSREMSHIIDKLSPGDNHNFYNNADISLNNMIMKTEENQNQFFF